MLGVRSAMLVRAAAGSARFYSSKGPKRKVNAVFEPGIPTYRANKACKSCDATPCLCPDHSPSKDSQNVKKLLEEHRERDWSQDELKDALKKHTLFTWGATDDMREGAISIKKAEGIYFWDETGKRYIDWNSQAMCVNLGHSPDQSIIDAVVKQMETQTYSYPCNFYADIRPKVCKLLADIFPGDINCFLFPSSGAEANEAAMRIARISTGRHKILARYRSYHGATLGAMTLTGDQRRWPAEAGANGIVHFMDPFPYSYKWGDNEEEIADKSLTYLSEVLDYEGPHKVAAIHMESITGTNGVLKPPKGYLAGVRALCDKHGILMVIDEVMAGFGRSGKMFGFCHEPNVIPDIVTFAKGVNGAYIPLGGVGLRDKVAEYIRKNPVAYGSTYNSHPVALASAYASLKVLLRDGLVQNAANNEKYMKEGLQRLLDNHPSVKQARCVGMFACFDLQKNKRGDFWAKVYEPPNPKFVEFKKALLKEGLFTMMRGHHVHCNPPLIATPEQIKEGFDILDKCLPILDNAMED